MKPSDQLRSSLINLSSICRNHVSAEQAPLQQKQRALSSLEFADQSLRVAQLVREAASAEDPRPMLLEAAGILVEEDKAITARQLAASAAESLQPDIDALERKLGKVSTLDYQTATLLEQARKLAVLSVSDIGGRSAVDVSVQKHLLANRDAIAASVGMIRDEFKDGRVTEACIQFLDDLSSFVDQVVNMEGVL